VSDLNLAPSRPPQYDRESEHPRRDLSTNNNRVSDTHNNTPSDNNIRASHSEPRLRTSPSFPTRSLQPTYSTDLRGSGSGSGGSVRSLNIYPTATTTTMYGSEADPYFQEISKIWRQQDTSILSYNRGNSVGYGGTLGAPLQLNASFDGYLGVGKTQTQRSRRITPPIGPPRHEQNYVGRDYYNNTTSETAPPPPSLIIIQPPPQQSTGFMTKPDPVATN